MPTNFNRANYPYGIYTIPEILSSERRRSSSPRKGSPTAGRMAFFREIAQSQIRGDTTGRLKLISIRPLKELLGVHIIGEGLGAPAHRAGGFRAERHVEYFGNVFNYPTLAECYKAAAFNGLNKTGPGRITRPSEESIDENLRLPRNWQEHDA